MTLHISTGTRFVEAKGWVERGLDSLAEEVNASAALKLAQRRRVEFFHPNTTTLVEVTVDQVPIADEAGAKLVGFTDQQERMEARNRRRQEEAKARKQTEAEESRQALDEAERRLEEDAAASRD